MAKPNTLPKRDTKLKAHMQLHGINREQLYQKIKKLYPDDPITRATLSKIMHGQLENYQVFTLYRLMNATGLKPNDLLHWEENLTK